MPEIVAPEGDHAMAEALGDVADIRDLKLDLDKAEKIRTVALIMGIRYYTETIIKDAGYLDRMIRYEEDCKRRNDPDVPPIHLRPATVAGVISAAHEFEQFLLGRSSIVESITMNGERIEPERVQDTTEANPKETP